MSSRFATVRRVEFGDTDMAGIMHFANFFRFMEVAETEYLTSRGLSVSFEWDGERVGFPRVSVSCDYSVPAKFGDLLKIEVTLEKLGRKSASYRFDFSRDEEPIAVGRMTSVFCRKSPTGGMESIEIPAELRAKISE